MEYQKMINLLDNTPNQLSKFRTKYCIEINDQSRKVRNTNSDIRFTMLKSSLCDYSHAYILVKERITITGAGDDAATSSAANKGRSMVNCCQSPAFDLPYLSCNDHCDRWLFQEIFFY